MNKKISLTQIITVVFLSTIFVIALYSLGFFTNLFQIRGVDRKLYDMYQSYVRMVFDLCLIGVLLVVIRGLVLSQMNKKNTILQFTIGALLALGIAGISVYSLLRMGEFHTLYQGILAEDVRVFYPKYEYNDSIFFIGYALYSATLIISIVYLIMRSIQTTWKQKEADK